MPTYFYREKEAAKRTSIDRDVCVSRKPYFMIYRYADISVEYQKYRRKANHDCRVQFKCTVDELLEKTPRTNEEETFISWYKNNSPVSLGDCTSNKICRKIEKYTDDMSIYWAKESGKFDYTIYRNPTDTKHKEINFNAIDKIISRYEESLNTLTKYAKSRRMSNTEVEEYRRSLAEETKEECYCNCSSAADLCNIILDLTYGHGKPSQIPWDLCGDVMIRNLLSKNDNQISYYEKSPDGEVEYRGNRFTHKVCKIKEDDDASLE